MTTVSVSELGLVSIDDGKLYVYFSLVCDFRGRFSACSCT